MNTLKGYIAIARPDHWVKHIFILPGIALALLLVDKPQSTFPWTILWGFAAACMIASANYVINEWLDAKFDSFHPIKKNRPAVSGNIKAQWVYVEYALLISLGLFFSWQVNVLFTITSVLLLIMGVLYNVEPIRLKDKVFMDVLSESVNNPLRLMMGWTMVSPDTIAPTSLFILYWFGGAYLMAAKRLAEFRFIKSQKQLDTIGKYRKSFRFYTEQSLMVSMFCYALISMFFISAFLIKYRNEYLFAFPFFVALFTYYLSLALNEVSIAQTPEKLHKDKKLVGLVVALIVALGVLTFVNIPVAKKIVGVDEQNINYRFWE